MDIPPARLGLIACSAVVFITLFVIIATHKDNQDLRSANLEPTYDNIIVLKPSAVESEGSNRIFLCVEKS